MDWNPFTLSLATFFGTALGWWVAHYLSSRRDVANERRKLIVSYLLDAYRKLENIANRDDVRPFWSDMESATADIQLLGSAPQVGLVQGLIKQYGDLQKKRQSFTGHIQCFDK